jgi:hypothetical protein
MSRRWVALVLRVFIRVTLRSSVIVHDLHVIGVAIAPREAYPPLIVDTDAVPPLALKANDNKSSVLSNITIDKVLFHAATPISFNILA